MTKLKATHLVDDGVYLIDRQRGFEYEVDGMPTPPGQFVVKTLDSIVQVTRTRGELLNWRDADGNTLTAAEYAEQKAALLVGATQDDDLDWHFPNLDAEFAYRKFLAQWQPGDRAPDAVTRTPVEAEVVEVRVNSGDPDIVSLWNSPTLHVDQRLYSMSRDSVMLKAFNELCAAADLKTEVPHHSGLRFAKIEGDYAFDATFDESKTPFIGTLEACKAEKAARIARVTAVVRAHEAKKRGLHLQNAGAVALGLKKVQTNLSGVRSKQDTAASLNAAKRDLAALISAIERELA